MNDPIVQEVRRYRMEHTHKFGGILMLFVMIFVQFRPPPGTLL